MRPALLTTLAALASVLVLSCSAAQQLSSQEKQVLFICEHGNVKSLMAASYFNQLAHRRNLPYRAVAQGTNPNSTTVPPEIVNGLGADAIDVSSFHPSRLRESDISRSARVIAIGVDLPLSLRKLAPTRIEEWNDIPPATLNFAESREALRDHVAKLIDDLSKTAAHPSGKTATR